MQLPDCSQLEEPLALLSAAEKRDLLLAMARGEDTTAWIARRAEHDDRWKRLLERFETQVESEVQAYRDRLEDELEDDRERINQTKEERASEIQERMEQAQRRLQRTRSKREQVLDEALSEAELARKAREVEADRTAWERFVAWILDLWFRLKRWLRRVVTGSDAKRTVQLAGPAGTGAELDVGFALKQSAEFRQAIKDRLRSDPLGKRLKRFRDRLLGRRDYEDIVRDLVADEVEQVTEQKEQEIEQEEEAVESEVEELEEDLEGTEEAAQEALAELERRRREAEEEIRRRKEEEPLEHLADEVEAELRKTGLVDDAGPTRRLLSRLSELLFEAEVRGLRGSMPTALSRPQGAETALEKHPLVTLAERSRADLVESLLNARMRHPNVRHLTEQDLVVYRNTEQPRAHVVLICDISASMEEHDRMGAAKRATFALHGAVAEHRSDHAIDVVLMGTDVRRAGLQDVWNADPHGFTNTGGALALARKLLLDDPADAPMVFLVTDGLPEAVMEGGDAVAAHPGEATAYAVEQARRLYQQVPDLEFTCVLLEPDEEMFVEAAEDLAEELHGHVVATDPEDLAGHLLVEFGEGVAEKGEPKVV